MTVLAVVGLAVIVTLVYVVASSLVLAFSRSPSVVWVVCVVGIVGALWWISSVASWSVNVPTWTSIVAFFLTGGFALPQKGADKRQERYWWAGRGAFAAASVVGWIFFYGEMCKLGGECVPLREAVFR